MSENTESWTVRAYRTGDEHQLIKLFETVFSRPVTLEHWLWKLRGLPTSLDNSWLVVAGERIIGHYGCSATINLSGR